MRCFLLKMIVPVVFSFDSNLILSAKVCIYSLLKSAMASTFYDIYILYPSQDDFVRNAFSELGKLYSNYKISFIGVDGEFKDAFEIRGITSPTYYRLLIPNLIPHYKKIIYADVDIIFRQDLSRIYEESYDEYYIAATYDLGMNLLKDGKEHVKDLFGENTEEYIQAGFLVLNCELLRTNNMVEVFKSLVKRKMKFQDQDVLNIACRGKIRILPWDLNMTDYSFYFVNACPNLLSKRYANVPIEIARKSGNIHYNGHKPWKGYCVNFDIWWEYYRNSPFYDEKFYFDFFYNKLNELEQLSLWKRVKILLRYFVFGRQQCL